MYYSLSSFGTFILLISGICILINILFLIARILSNRPSWLIKFVYKHLSKNIIFKFSILNCKLREVFHG